MWCPATTLWERLSCRNSVIFGSFPSAAKGQSIPQGMLCQGFLPHPPVHHKGHFQDARLAREPLRSTCAAPAQRWRYARRACAAGNCRRVLRSERRMRTLVQGLNRTTLDGLVVDDDRRPCVELVLDLRDFRGEGDAVDTIVGPLARHEGFDDAAYGIRTEHAVGNDRGHDASFLWTG